MIQKYTSSITPINVYDLTHRQMSIRYALWIYKIILTSFIQKVRSNFCDVMAISHKAVCRRES